MGPTAPLTPYGQLPFFIEYLKVAGLFDAMVADCPLNYTSPNAPEKRDVLGATMLSVLAGHKRYAHITALRNHGVLPELLGMTKIVSEDAVRRAVKAIREDEGRQWLQHHLDYCTAPLLAEPWVLDLRRADGGSSSSGIGRRGDLLLEPERSCFHSALSGESFVIPRAAGNGGKLLRGLLSSRAAIRRC